MKNLPNKKLTPKFLRQKGIMKGFEYLTPKRQKVVDEIEKKFRLTVESFGFEKIEGPLLQPVEFYLIKSGEELLEHTYVFTEVDDSQLVLRPELTPTVAYMIARDDARLSFPLRWWSNPFLFRKEKPQKGRKRQFNQLNIDIFDRADSGRDRAFDDAEIIAVAVSIFSSFGFTEEDIVIQINSRSLVGKLFDLAGFDTDQRSKLLSLIDKAKKISENEINLKLKEVVKDSRSMELLKNWLSITNPKEIVENKQLRSLGTSRELAELNRVFDILETYNVSKFCEFSPYIIRGLGYYTGTVFEAFDRKKENGFKRALMGGGRYDDLTKDLGGKLNITGVGFGLGQVPLEEMLASRGIKIKISESQVDFYVIVQSEGQRMDAIKISQELRSLGKRVIIDDSIPKEKLDKVNKQLSRANKAKTKHSLLIFPEEWKKGRVIVKDMATGKQRELELENIVLKLSSENKTWGK